LPDSRNLLIKNAAQLVTCEPHLFDASDDEARSIGLIEDGSVLVSNGVIQWVGRTSDIGDRCSRVSEVIDAAGMVVLPGLVDSHTHAVFAGTREREYELRIRGTAYMEIARRGGGINSTVEQVRKASLDDLVSTGLARLRSMLRKGTTTVEVKSGYGLDTDSELKMLRAMRRLDDEARVDIVPTFLGAHEIPPEFRDNRDRYVDIVTDEMIPAVSEQGLAEFCDVFCEKGVFTAEEARRILLRGKEYGLKPKIHADEFADSGGALVAGEVGAVSAGHLAFASLEGLEAMKEAGTVAVLLPGVSVGLGKCEFADARKMLDLGLEVAIATDFNPGSSMVDSLLIVSSLACSFMKMTPAEAILGMTMHASRAVGRTKDIGSLAEAKKADIVLFDAPDFRYIPYHLGGDMVSLVIKDGDVVVSNAQDAWESGRTSRPEVL
jgi:imidazolonepropionase